MVVEAFVLLVHQRIKNEVISSKIVMACQDNFGLGSEIPTLNVLLELSDKVFVIAFCIFLGYPLLFLASFFLICEYCEYIASFFLSYLMLPWIFAKLSSLYDKESFMSFSQSQSFIRKTWNMFKITLQSSTETSQKSSKRPHPFQEQAFPSAVQNELAVIEIPFLNFNPVRLHRSQPDMSSVLDSPSIRPSHCQSEIRKNLCSGSIKPTQNHSDISTAIYSHIHRPPEGESDIFRTADTSSLKPSQSKILNVLSDNPKILCRNTSDMSISTRKNKICNDTSHSKNITPLFLPFQKRMKSLENIPRLVDYNLSSEMISSSENSVAKNNPRKKRKKKRVTIFHRPKLRRKKLTTVTE
ncbi:hypothetical protein NPIL_636841 [Nephila pilipes]|uniref:Uncharacterized protein n=1 Tax=Nephila pilipes TaxID=299642 RepID=A0A8X6UVQ3_NEPPI|nr:hypothetical protein NPIL_636841 [Nephila pilipes]